MISFRCSDCGKALAIQDQFAGKKAKCPCGHVGLVPAAVAADTCSGPHGLQTFAPTASDHRTRTGPTTPRPPASNPDHAERANFLAPPQAPDEIGRLGPYRVLKILGQGAMGVVLLAEDPQLKRLVALKAMLPEVAAGPTARQRFLREAQAAATLEHDHIVAIYQVGEDRGVPFLAMPLLKGESLDQRLKREGRLPVADVLRIGREMALGLAAAHAHGLVHRDIKPGNIWLEAGSQRVKILDFGLARRANPDVQLTQSGAIMGTPAFMAPEQAQGKAVDARCDLFSLGCVLYRMATGQLPFNGPDTMAMLLALVTQQPRPPEQINPGIPRALNDLILALLAKEPSVRPPSAEAVVSALAALETNSTPRMAPAPVAPRTSGPLTPVAAPASRPARRYRRLLIGAIAASAALVVALVLIVHGGEQADDPVDPTPPHGQPKIDQPVRPDVAGPSGKPLSRLALVRAPTSLPGVRSWTIETRMSRNQARAVAFHPKKARLACSSGDGMVRIFDTAKGRLIQVLAGNPQEVGCLAWSPDGLALATGCKDGLVRLWLPDKGRLARTFTGHTGPVQSLAWAPGGKVLASGGGDGAVRRWRVDADQPLPPLRGLNALVAGLAWSPDGKRLASHQGGKTIVWETPAGTVLRRFDAGHANFKSVSWSPDSNRLACIGGQGIQIWDVDEGRVLHDWKAHAYGTYAVSWAPDGGWLASTGHDSKVKLWTSAGKEVRAWNAPVTNFRGTIDWAPDSKTMAYSCWAGVQLRQADSGKQLLQWTDNGWGATALAVAPNRDVLATPHHDSMSGGTVRLWEISTARLERSLRVINGHLNTLAWSPDGKALAITGFSPDALVVDVASGRRRDLRGSPHPRHVSWSPDGKILAVCDERGHASLYDADLTLLRPLQGGGPIWWTTWTPNSYWLATTDEQSSVVRMFEAATGRYRPVGRRLGNRGAVNAVAIGPGGMRIASGGTDQVVRTWGMKNARVRAELRGHTGAITALAWSLDRRALASGSADKTVRVWRFRDNKPVLVLKGHPVRIDGLAWSPKNGLLAVQSGGTILLWDVDTDMPKPKRLGSHSVGLAWAADGRTLISATGAATVELWDPATGELRCSLVNLRNEQGLAVTPDGHYAGTPEVESELVYVVDTGAGQVTITPEEFARRFGWKNDPSRVGLKAP